MESIKSTLSCAICSQVFEFPVVLPCGHSVCAYHCDETQVSARKTKKRKLDDTKLVECSKCQREFEIPTNGFAPNLALEELLKRKIHKIEMTDEHKEALKCSQRVKNLYGSMIKAFCKECL